MKLLIDTNVILDMVLERKNASVTRALFRKIHISKDAAYVTASSITDLFYIARKETHSIDNAYQILDDVFKLVSVIPVSEADILEAFDFKWKDFEDCVQYTAAKNYSIGCIITNNTKDFELGDIPVILPKNY